MTAGRKPGAINLGKWFLVPRDGDDDDFGIVWPPPAEDVEARPLRVSVLLRPPLLIGRFGQARSASAGRSRRRTT